MSEEQFEYHVPAGGAVPPPPPQSPPPQTPPPAPQRGGRSFFGRLWHGCLVASFCFVAFGLLLVFCATWSCSRLISSGIESASSFEQLSAGEDDFALAEVRELNLSAGGRDAGAPSVLFVPLVGEITAPDSRARLWEDDTGTAAGALRAIRRATIDRRIAGILLRIDSPGGEVTASDDIWKALADFRASAPDESGTPRFVVAIMGSMAASGGYYACAGADWIVAHPTTITGSIGVKMTSFNVRRLAERLGVDEETIASGPNKNILSPFQTLTEEQRALLQKIVDSMQDRFVSIVAGGRRMDESRVRELADGRIFLGTEAKEAGLVDEVGYLADAMARVAERLGGKTPVYVAYRQGGAFFKAIFTPDFVGASIRKAFPEAAAARRAPEAGL